MEPPSLVPPNGPGTEQRNRLYESDHNNDGPATPAETETETYNLPLTGEDADFLYDCLAYSDHMKACDSARVEEMIARIRSPGVGVSLPSKALCSQPIMTGRAETHQRN